MRMKPTTLLTGRYLLPALALLFSIGLISWDYQQKAGAPPQNHQDTLPKKKKEKKVKDLDEVLADLAIAWPETHPQLSTKDAALPTLHTGDEISVRCTYDNTVDNKALVAALLKAHLPGPVDVHYGNEALDEMCFAAITLFYKAADAP